MQPLPPEPANQPQPASATRRQFLQGAATVVGAGAALGAWVAGCTTGQPASGCGPAAGADAAATGRPVDASVQLDTAGGGPGPALEVDATLPYRQHDPKWGKDLMWNRSLVIKAATQLNGETKADAESLLREFDDGNNIANEGCMLACMAMVLRLLAPTPKLWTPKNLNAIAQQAYYYTPCGLSMTTLYADLVSEVSEGQVQLCLKAEYLPGVTGWPKLRARDSALVRAYRSLTPSQRAPLVVMLKTGTYDDTVASHYVLLHPDDSGALDEDNLRILDPAQPLGDSKPWRLTDSAATILEDPDIAAQWQDQGIDATQLGGVWMFARWSADRRGPQIGALAAAWAKELANGAG